jgi:F-type H+/Na+-transporting ATPase subunit alpha
MQRGSINASMETGIKVIDALVPIGKDKENLLLVIDKLVKQHLLLIPLLNQKGKDVICIYVAIGQKESASLLWFNYLMNIKPWIIPLL